MSKKINLICGIVAILCVAVMFVPMGEERGHGNQFNQWLNVGQMQYAWGHATSGFTSSDPLYGTMAISLSLSAVLLILWALQSFRRRPNAGTMGVVATIIHVLATVFSLLMFLEGFDGNAFMPVVIVVGVLAIAALVLAIIQKRAGKT